MSGLMDKNTASMRKDPSKNTSLSLQLVLWFLLLTLLPLAFVSWFNYQQTNSSLVTAAQTELKQSSQLTVRSIKDWFDYRLADVNIQAESPSNHQLLTTLIDGFKQSNQTLEQYVTSEDWKNRVSDRPNNLITLSQRYDYIADIYLIDNQGNILYSLEQEKDFGRNILAQPLRSSRFASSIKKALISGETAFSGLERYALTRQDFASFLSAPIKDEDGTVLGTFSIQVKLDHVFSLLQSTRSENNSLTHYFIAENGTLRTPIGDNWSEVLLRKISTEQYQLFLTEDNTLSQTAENYMGPNGEFVIGTHSVISLANINWVLISETGRDEALASAKWIGKITFILVLLTALFVTCLAFIVTRRITKPLVQLANASRAVAAGETNQQVVINTKNEIGQLADAFNHMLDARMAHEQALELSTKKAEEALEYLAEQQFALDQHAIVAITNVQGTITYANDKFLQISGYERDELLGQNHRLLNSGHHSTEFFKQMYKTIAHGDTWHGEICNQDKNGDIYWVDTTIVPFKGDDGKPESYIAIRADITQRKYAEQAILGAKELAEEAAKTKSEFLASMSHEIRTPMNGVLGMLGLLLNTKLDEVQQHRARVAQASAQSLLTLINDILDFSKVDAGKLELEVIDFDLRGMLGEFSEAVALQAQAKGLELILDVKGVEQSLVKGDPGRLRQILTNLVGNAIKFTLEGEIVIRVSLERDDENKMHMHCSVTDTGIGIPIDKQAELFDSFSQVDASTTRRFGGTGLGLAICRKLCQLMQGDIGINSTSGQGSCFEFSVVLENSRRAKQVVPHVDIQTLNVLIVDDNATNREVLATQLRHWGAQVEEADGSLEALKRYKERFAQKIDTFDVAFLDMQMPEINGADLGVMIKADDRFKSSQLIMMTSMAHQGDAKRFAALGFSAYFPKPATTSDILDALLVVADRGEALQYASPLVTQHYLKDLAKESPLSSKEKTTTKEYPDIKETEHPTKTVHLPQSPRATETIDSNTQESPWPDNTRILLVEDNQVNQMVATGVLNDMGLQVDVAGNGQEALHSLEFAATTSPYNLVLMDCQMPVMDGYKATESIRAGRADKADPSITIIAMTANAMAGDREKCLAVGMNDYLPKPIDPEALHRMMQKWLLNMDGETLDLTGLEPELGSQQEQSSTIMAPVTDTTTLWDKEAALKRIMHQEDLLHALIDVFLSDFPEQLTELKKAVEQNDFEQTYFISHTLKGLAANLSGLELQHLSLQIETMAQEKSPNIAAKMPNYITAADAFIACLEDYMATVEYAAPENALLSLDEIGNHLKELLDKVKIGDYIDPEELTPLQGASDNSLIQKLLDQLLSQINVFDFTAAMDTLKELETETGITLSLSEKGKE